MGKTKGCTKLIEYQSRNLVNSQNFQPIMYEHGYDHCINLHPCARCSTKKQMISKNVDGGQQMDATSYTAQQREDLKEELDC